jgi:hypothetical protein
MDPHHSGPVRVEGAMHHPVPPSLVLCQLIKKSQVDRLLFLLLYHKRVQNASKKYQKQEKRTARLLSLALLSVSTVQFFTAGGCCNA